MIRSDREVLSAIGLAIDAPAFGWLPGVGLRWSLPSATFLRGDAAVASGEPAGWPDDGYVVYRAALKDVAEYACLNLAEIDAPTSYPAPIGDGLTLDLIAEATTGSVADALSAGGAATLHADAPLLALRMAAKATEDRTGRLQATAYGSGGEAVASLDVPVATAEQWTIEGPDIVRVEVLLVAATVVELCTLGQPPALLSALLERPIAQVRPVTDAPRLAKLMPDAQAGAAGELAEAIAAAVLDPAARFTARGEGPPADGPQPVFDTPVLDLLMLAGLEPWMAQACGLLHWDQTAGPGAHLYAVTGRWDGVHWAWVLPPLTPAPPAPFLLPASLVPSARERSPMRPASADGTARLSACAAEVSWRLRPPGGGPPAAAGDRAARFVIERASAPPHLAASERHALLTDARHFVPLGPPVVVGADDVVAILDSGMEDGFHAWRVTGLDLFNRPSVPVVSAELELWDTLAPPPPAHVRAAFLDAAALTAEGAAARDPFMTAAHAAWLRLHPEERQWLYVGFDWPPAHAAATAVREFHVLCWPSADVPRARARIVSVSPDARAGTALVELDASLGDSAAAFSGGSLSDGRAVFEVVSARPGPTSSVVSVRMRGVPRTIVPVPDGTGGGTHLTEGTDPPRFNAPESGREAVLAPDLRDPGRWPRRWATVPVRPPLERRVAAIDDDRRGPGGERSLRLRLDGMIEHPDGANGVFFEGGWLETSGDAHPVSLLVTDGADRRLAPGGARLVVTWPPDAPAPTVGQSATYHPGYGVYRPHRGFRPAERAVGYQLVTVTAVRPSAAPAGATTGGFESPAAVPATVVDVKRDAPAPPRPAGPRLTGWPDADGLASYALRWPAQAGLRYVVLRALDEELFAHDRDLRRRAGSSYGTDEVDGPGDLAARSRPADFPDAEHPEAPDYRRIPDAEVLRRIASLPGNAAAFTPAMTTPVGASDLVERTTTEDADDGVTALAPGAWRHEASGELVFVDLLPGIGTARWFYRVQAVDVAGNHSAPGLSTLPVVARIPRLPLEPALTDLRLGDRSVTLLWDHPADGSVERYAVFFAATAEELRTLELRRPAWVTGADVVLGATPAEDRRDPGAADAAWGWIGTELPAGEAAVAIVAEREMAGAAVLRSPAAIRRVRVLELSAPTAPSVTALERVDGQVRVAWAVGRPWHETLVEWRADGDDVWRSTGGWRAATLPHELAITESAGGVEVRVRVRNSIAVSIPVRATLYAAAP